MKSEAHDQYRHFSTKTPNKHNFVPKPLSEAQQQAIDEAEPDYSDDNY